MISPPLSRVDFITNGYSNHVNKIYTVDDRVIIAGTGSVGIGQRFYLVVKDLWDKKIFQGPALRIAETIAHHVIHNLGNTARYPNNCNFGALLAYSAEGRSQLCEFELKTLQPELKTEEMYFCSLGSTTYMTDPFLGFMRKVYWQKGLPDLPDGIFAANWTLQHAIELNTGGVGGNARIALLESKKGQYFARILENEELQESNQHIRESEDRLREIRAIHNGSHITEAPDIPKP